MRLSFLKYFPTFYLKYFTFYCYQCQKRCGASFKILYLLKSLNLRYLKSLPCIYFQKTSNIKKNFLNKKSGNKNKPRVNKIVTSSITVTNIIKEDCSSSPGRSCVRFLILYRTDLERENGLSDCACGGQRSTSWVTRTFTWDRTMVNVGVVTVVVNLLTKFITVKMWSLLSPHPTLPTIHRSIKERSNHWF